MSSEVRAAAEALRARLSSFDPELISTADCAALVDVLAATEKACATAKARAAARAAAGGAHRAAGFADPADWLARASGSTAGDANVALRTAVALDDLPVTKQAVVSGAVSIEQAHEIVRTEAERPGTERELLGLAEAGAGLATLRDRARRRRHETVDRDELHRRQRRARHFRHWLDDLGMICFRGALPPEIGVAFVNRVDTACDRLWREAHRAGLDEPRDACAADALASLVTGTHTPANPALDRHGLSGPHDGTGDGTLEGALDGPGDGTGNRSGEGPGDGGAVATPSGALATTSCAPAVPRPARPPAAEVVVVVDLSALRRGHTHGDEPCHVIGGGPIPVHVARDILEADAFVKAALHDGVDITTVAHLGRYKKAELRTALALGQPPLFEGATCSAPGCERRHGLQWDHIDPVANHGPTSYDNLQPLCRPHHTAKTETDRRAGLLGRRGPP